MKGYLTICATDEFQIVVTPTEGVPSLSDMQAVVDGYIETAFRVPSPFRKNVSIDAYVNEEGLLIGLPRFVGVVDTYGQRTFAGNMVIVGGNENTGNTIALNEKELDYVTSKFNGHYFVLADI
jgi:hypothetical protein